jgi:hypothetical protein
MTSARAGLAATGMPTMLSKTDTRLKGQSYMGESSLWLAAREGSRSRDLPEGGYVENGG